MRIHIVLFFLLAVSLAHSDEKTVEHIGDLVQARGGTPVVLKGTEMIQTKASFQPPVEIIIEAKTDSTDLRIGYAADQVIFNWRTIPHQLRVDGGPADKKHKVGAGLIPPNKYVKIRWVVTAEKQTIYVDDQLKYEHEGDYSGINNPVTVFSDRSKVSVKSIKVKKLDPQSSKPTATQRP